VKVISPRPSTFVVTVDGVMKHEVGNRTSARTAASILRMRYPKAHVKVFGVHKMVEK
jgi:hypothetical protein